jgi:hypothetical protein
MAISQLNLMLRSERSERLEGAAGPVPDAHPSRRGLADRSSA